MKLREGCAGLGWTLAAGFVGSRINPAPPGGSCAGTARLYDPAPAQRAASRTVCASHSLRLRRALHSPDGVYCDQPEPDRSASKYAEGLIDRHAPAGLGDWIGRRDPEVRFGTGAVELSATFQKDQCVTRDQCWESYALIPLDQCVTRDQCWESYALIPLDQCVTRDQCWESDALIPLDQCGHQYALRGIEIEVR